MISPTAELVPFVTINKAQSHCNSPQLFEGELLQGRRAPEPNRVRGCSLVPSPLGTRLCAHVHKWDKHSQGYLQGCCCADIVFLKAPGPPADCLLILLAAPWSSHGAFHYNLLSLASSRQDKHPDTSSAKQNKAKQSKNKEWES